MLAKSTISPPKTSAATRVRAAVRVVLPWSTWPIVPTLTWILLRSNCSFAIQSQPYEKLITWMQNILASNPRESILTMAFMTHVTRITVLLIKGVSFCVINEVFLVIYHAFTQNTAPIF
jgi:hypothetical protein